MSIWNESKDNIWVAAHRGWSEKYPENTMEAYKAAVALGVDQLEIDVRVTADDQLVLIHDASVDRTTDGTGLVREKTLAELKTLDAGSWKGDQFRGCRIPSFDEFMDYIKDLPDMTVDFELKEYPVEGKEQLAYDVCDRVIQAIIDIGWQDKCIINTFSGKLHEYIIDKYGPIFRHHVYFPLHYHCGPERGGFTRDPYTYGYSACMFGKPNMASQEDFDHMRETYGIRCWAGASVKDEATVDEAIAKGSELITCNNPDVILDLLRKKGYHK